LINGSKITNPSLVPQTALGKRTNRAGGHLPFKREAADIEKKAEEKEVKESKELKEIRKRNKTANLSRRKFED
jgi:hypothetical protein